MHITRNIWHSVGGLKRQSQLYFTHLYPSRFVPECKVNLKLVRICVPASAWQIPSLDIYLHSALRVVLVLMFFMSATFFFPLKSRLKGSKDEMLLDMINKQRTSVNVCSYTHWMTGCNWLQPVWCNKAHYYANPSGPGDSNVVCCGWVREREREGGKETIKKVWDGEREREQMNGCVSVWSHCVSVHACLSHWEACNTKAAATLVFSALTTLLVIGMTFENILIEDKRLNSEWVDLSPAKLQLEGWGRNNANRSPQNM